MALYDLIHVDPTIVIFKRNLKIETVVERTIELIPHSENFRKLKNKPPISYEVGLKIVSSETKVIAFGRFAIENVKKRRQETRDI